MLGLPLAFAVPGILAALVLLPALYLLLRLTPPRPRAVPLPPLRLILDLVPKDETPARTPPWLLLLRLLVAALIILAMAGPLWNPPASVGAGRGPLLIVLDDGFAAATTWPARTAYVRQQIAGAERAGRVAAVAAVSDGARAVEALSPGLTAERLRARRPVPVEPDRMAALPAIAGFAGAQAGTEIVWIGDGLERGGGRAFARGLAGIAGLSSLAVVEGSAIAPALAGAANTPESLDVRVVRAAGGNTPDSGVVTALDARGLPVAEAPFGFGTGTEATARFALPVELRNDIARLVVANTASAGAVTLLDGRARRRRVAVVTGGTADVAQPLLSPSYYVSRALAPFATVTEARGASADPIATLLDQKPSVMVLADVGAVLGPAHDRLARFVEEGGVLLRFAGTRLAASAGDDLVPVTLRRGGRTFGGALSWDKPKPLAPFDRTSLFFGLVPPVEVTVARQVLAEPDAGLPGKTWAQLTDGTPLVTAEKRGKGMVVLVHVTADTTWSNLPLSGLFVDMLRRVVDLSPASIGGDAAAPSPGGTPETAALLGPTRTLDGFGALGTPPVTARPVPANFEAAASLDHPPGFYGPPDAGLAVNALRAGDMLDRVDLAGLAIEHRALETAEPIDLRAALITLALVGFLADALASLWLGGGLRRRGRLAGPAAAAALATGLLLMPWVLDSGPARAEETGAVSHRDMDAALTTRLGYIVTGDAGVDETSRLGLITLSHALADRTSLAPGDPVGLDPGRDELAFYPLLYWPVVSTEAQPAPATVEKVAAYMKGGGTVVFDTRDALTARPGGPPTAETGWLRTMLAGVDVPELEPVPSDHVVTKTFYLLSGFVGRYASGQTWIEALPPASREDTSRPVRAGDSVSPILITANDLAAGWAAGPDGEALYPLVPGGSRQRELALRGGINLVMYTLTGNYKADQVHVRDLLERLAH